MLGFEGRGGVRAFWMGGGDGVSSRWTDEEAIVK